jgi:hypothetical protein
MADRRIFGDSNSYRGVNSDRAADRVVLTISDSDRVADCNSTLAVRAVILGNSTVDRRVLSDCGRGMILKFSDLIVVADKMYPRWVPILIKFSRFN